MRPSSALVLLLFLACKKDAPTPAPVAAPPAVVVAGLPAGQLTLTPVLLDSYLAYQQTLLDRADAGLLDRAKREEEARKKVGVSDRDLLKIDELVAAVVARRMVSHLTANPAFTPDLERMGQNLPADQKKRLEEAMAAFKASQQQSKELKTERDRFGSENVDLLLTREAELTKNWQAMMDSFGTRSGR